jgi:hypothetical protein
MDSPSINGVLDNRAQSGNAAPTTAGPVDGAAVARAYLQYAADERDTRSLGVRTTVVALLWLELATEYPFRDMRQKKRLSPGKAPPPAPRWMDHFRKPDEAWTWFKEASQLLAEKLCLKKPDATPLLLRIHHYRPPGGAIGSANNQDEVRSAVSLVHEAIIVDEAIMRMKAARQSPTARAMPPAPEPAVVLLTGPPGAARRAAANPRRGRLPKAESEPAKAAFMAEIRKHPTLKDDPAAVARLAVDVHVSVRTARRWLAEMEKAFFESRAARTGAEQ